MPHLLGDADQLHAVVLLQLLDGVLVNGIHHEQHLQEQGKSVSVSKVCTGHTNRVLRAVDLPTDEPGAEQRKRVSAHSEL